MHFKHLSLAVFTASVLGLTAFAANSWVYDSTAKTLTEQVTDGSTAWVFTGVTVSSGKLTLPAASTSTKKYTQGDSKALDFTTIVNAEGTTSYKLVKISDYAFYNNDYIARVIAPEVTALSTYAFYDCDALTYAEFPKVTELTSNAFNSCGELVDLIGGQLTTIEAAAIEACVKLTLDAYRNPDTGIVDLSSVTSFSKNRWLYAVTGTVSFAGRSFTTSDQGTFSGWSGVTEFILKPNYMHGLSSTSPFGNATSLKTIGPLDDEVLSQGFFSSFSSLEYLTLGSDTTRVCHLAD